MRGIRRPKCCIDMSRSVIVLACLFVLLTLHQDIWFWDDDKTLFLGCLPVGLAYHMVYSIGIAVFWWWASWFAWPKGLELPAEASLEDSQSS